MNSRFPEESLGARILEGSEKSGIFKGKKWSIHDSGITVANQSILWKDVERLYISASSYSVNLVPMGASFSITIIDSSEREIKLNLSSGILGRRSKREEFSNVYRHILSFVEERQRKEFLQRIKDGQRVSFKSFEITNEGIYCEKRLFRSGFDKLNPKSILGSTIRQGDFYILFMNDKGKVMERFLDSVNKIPNIHIAQRFFKLLPSLYQIEKSH